MTKSRNKKIRSTIPTQKELLSKIVELSDYLSYTSLDKLDGIIKEKLWDKYGAVNIDMSQDFGDAEDEI